MSVLVGVLTSVGLISALIWHGRGLERARQILLSPQPAPLQDMGTTRVMVLLPLVDWHTSRPELRGEPGVSYLIKTDQHSILFDLGFNPREEEPSPLLHNMSALGVSTIDFDTLVISHAHMDHVGGRKWASQKTFSLGNSQRDLSGKRVFTPIPMSYPGLQPVVSAQPRVLGPGIATLGAIPRQLFMGWVEEQALAIHVEGKGIVLVVGCGHQTLPPLLERTRALFPDVPLYGIIGGLHYPVPTGRLTWMGLNLQRIMASGDGPFKTLSEEEAHADIQRLASMGLGVVAVGGHDSSDEILATFRSTFGPAYRDLRVGEPIAIGL